MATIKSIEEKARAYDEAIKRVEDIKTGKCETRFMFTEGLFEHIFPALKESEDERIRENIIATIHLYYGEPLEDEAKEMIAWLEKQGEHAKFRDSIQVGDKVTRNQDGVLVNLSQIKRVAKPADKVETNLLAVERAKEISPFMRSGFEQKPADTEKGAKGNEREIPNSAWTEEDERHKNTIIRAIHGAGNITPIDGELAENWLKFLKDRYTWRPSEGILNLLERIIQEKANPKEYQASLTGLLGQLKKLKA